MEQVEVREVERLDQQEGRGRAVHLGHGHRPVERRHRRRRQRQQLVEEPEAPGPVLNMFDDLVVSSFGRAQRNRMAVVPPGRSPCPMDLEDHRNRARRSSSGSLGVVS